MPDPRAHDTALPAHSRREALDRRSRLLVAGQLWLLNVVALALLCTEYLGAVRPEPFRAWLFVGTGLVSCAASLSVVPGLLLLGVAALARSRRFLGIASALVWSLTLLAVFVDTRIYLIFRYHFNGLVWNVLTTPGADEAVSFSLADVVPVLLGLGVVIALEFLALGALWRRSVRGAPTRPLTRPRRVWALGLVPCMALTAGTYAYADAVRDPSVMAFAQVYPLFPRLTAKRFVVRVLGMELPERPQGDVLPSGILLDYPLAEVRLPADGPRPNVLVVVIDSLRADALVPEVMPTATRLAQRGRTFRDHSSTGNATRFGLFGMVYGLHGSYWRSFENEHRPPVLITALQEAGYEASALTAASWDFPEFRSTLWATLGDAAEDRLVGEREGGRDDGVLARFEEWLAARPEPERPFFSFLLLDAPHGRYSFPPEHAVFEPFVEDVRYLQLSDGATPEQIEGVRNRYLNAVHYDDAVLERLLAALEREGELEDTLVVVTGDHGEEFFENGFLGHTSNFTIEQTRVPLVLAGPGIPPGEETRPTSHVDLPATLLELLGLDPALRRSWTLGVNLLDPPAERVRVAAGWDTLGLLLPGGSMVVPLVAHRGVVAAYDEDWRVQADDSDLARRGSAALAGLALECRRFLR